MITISPYPQSLRIKIECDTAEEYIQFNRFIEKFTFKKDSNTEFMKHVREFQDLHNIGEIKRLDIDPRH